MLDRNELQEVDDSLRLLELIYIYDGGVVYFGISKEIGAAEERWIVVNKSYIGTQKASDELILCNYIARYLIDHTEDRWGYCVTQKGEKLLRSSPRVQFDLLQAQRIAARL